MRKKDNPEAWKELLKSMSQGEWDRARKIVEECGFYPSERDEVWRNTWTVITKEGEILRFRTAKDVAKGLRTSQTTITKACKSGGLVTKGRLEGYIILREKGCR